jgi:hypothetical protein
MDTIPVALTISQICWPKKGCNCFEHATSTQPHSVLWPLEDNGRRVRSLGVGLVRVSDAHSSTRRERTPCLLSPLIAAVRLVAVLSDCRKQLPVSQTVSGPCCSCEYRRAKGDHAKYIIERRLTAFARRDELTLESACLAMTLRRPEIEPHQFPNHADCDSFLSLRLQTLQHY